MFLLPIYLPYYSPTITTYSLNFNASNTNRLGATKEKNAQPNSYPIVIAYV